MFSISAGLRRGPRSAERRRWAAPERHCRAVVWRREQRGRGPGLAPTDRGAILAQKQVQARAEVHWVSPWSSPSRALDTMLTNFEHGVGINVWLQCSQGCRSHQDKRPVSCFTIRRGWNMGAQGNRACGRHTPWSCVWLRCNRSKVHLAAGVVAGADAYAHRMAKPITLNLGSRRAS